MIKSGVRLGGSAGLPLWVQGKRRVDPAGLNEDTALQQGGCGHQHHHLLVQGVEVQRLSGRPFRFWSE